MADVLLRYLQTARRLDASLVRRLFLQDQDLLAAGVEQLVEAAAARVDVRSQHEVVSERDEEHPASHRRSVRFFDEPRPRPPRPLNFEDRVEEFPIAGTLREFGCPRCGASGKLRCSTCSGSGNVRCGSCSGSGSRDGKRCGSCSGRGVRTCSTCDGDGRVRCPRCSGEGELAAWQTVVHTYTVQDRRRESFPLPDPPAALVRALATWLGGHAEGVESFDGADAERHLGYRTETVDAVCGHAERSCEALEAEAQSGARGRCLFLQSSRYLAPLGYSVLRQDERASWYWLLGRGAAAIEVLPWRRPDPVKLLGWLGTAGFLIVAGILVNAMLEGATIPGGDWWTYGIGAIASVAAAAIGLPRAFARPRLVRTVVVVSDSELVSPFLPCVAALGSYVGAFHVRDSAWVAHLDALQGGVRSERQSDSITVQLLDGRRVRIVQVAQRGDGKAFSVAASGVDGVVYLGGRTEDGANALEAAAGAPAPASARLELTEAELAELQREWVAGMQDDNEIRARFRRLWKPVADVLGEACP